MTEHSSIDVSEQFDTETAHTEITDVSIKSEPALAADGLAYQRFDKAKHESKTASILAFSFAYILAGIGISRITGLELSTKTIKVQKRSFHKAKNMLQSVRFECVQL